MAKDKAGIKDWYAKRFADLGKNPLVREHVFGTTVGKTIKLGYGGHAAERRPALLRLEPRAVVRLQRRRASPISTRPEFNDMFAELRDASTDTLAGLFRGQEMLMLNTALPHRDD